MPASTPPASLTLQREAYARLLRGRTVVAVNHRPYVAGQALAVHEADATFLPTGASVTATVDKVDVRQHATHLTLTLLRSR